MKRMRTLDPVITNSIAESASHGEMLVPIAVVIAVAAVLGLCFMRLRQPPLVGFILAGVALGPTGFGLISNNENVSLLAEMGVVVLLFFIGMELSIKAFVLSLRQALLVTSGQLSAAMVAGALIALLTNATVSEAIILGFIVAISSTVVAMKMLDEMGTLRGEAGRIAVGVLIAQDLAVVPMLIFVGSMGGGDMNIGAIVLKITVAVGLLGGLLWWLGRRSKLKVPFAEAVEDKIEILALGSLAVCFAAAAVSGLAGMSPVYGAFLAGILVGNSTLRSRVIPVIEPIQSILLVVFFLSIGLLIDLDFIWENLWAVLGAALIVIAAKSVLNIFLLRRTGSSAQTALIAGLSMAQIGEFSFVLAAVGFNVGALGADVYRVAIAVTALSLLVSPIWVSVMHRLENIATTRLQTYGEAFSVAYARELQEVSKRGAALADVSRSLRMRYRALRLARHHRQHSKTDSDE
ncbi:cation:proton antiporter [Pararhizobium sp.]|uniref:cation:proton antiporter n=1 Tax=Pararhizobium sp. TaxID=1977563 RepID=UPI0027286299|nr:cation:proton antiporter [Pararhizobium sp.]MDO9414588.1 cation:proton antiporter [Pararhizobium sp.]